MSVYLKSLVCSLSLALSSAEEIWKKAYMEKNGSSRAVLRSRSKSQTKPERLSWMCMTKMGRTLTTRANFEAEVSEDVE